MPDPEAAVDVPLSAAEAPGPTGPATATDRLAERERVARARADLAARRAKASLAAADRARDGEELRRANAGLLADLAPVARERGRGPVPKPPPLPNMPGAAGDDAWTR